MAKITPKSENLSNWYNDVIQFANLAEHGPVRGTMIIKPYGYAIWELIQKSLDLKIKDLGVDNVYFPLFIPSSFLQKEKTHVEHFSPEVAVVTHAGGEELTEPLIVRPTSETIMYDAFSRWIHSYRDLPLKINQWTNVIRWEKRTYMFLRGTEFLWQEGHTAHATATEAEEMAATALETYIDTNQNLLAVYGYYGQKSESEKFAGADATFTYEVLAPDGKVVQVCTSHNLGQNFSKVFDVKFQDKDKQEKYVYQTSWGFSTRSLGPLILVHGDDKGLVLPPKVAPIQVVVIPILSKNTDSNQILNFSGKVFNILKSLDIRVKIDDKDESPGWKFNQYELMGVPLRLEIGGSELASESVKMVRRDNSESSEVKIKDLESEINKTLEDIQSQLFLKSKTFTLDHTTEAKTYEQFKGLMKEGKGFIRAYWCEDPECERKIKEETKASTRALDEMGKLVESGECVYCKKLAKYQWLFAQSY